MTYFDETFDKDMDGYFLKLSPNCELLWSTYFYTKNSNVNDRVLSIASDGGGRLYFAGWVDKDLDYQNTHIIPFQDYSNASVDYFQQYRTLIGSNSQNSNEGIFGFFDSLKTENTAGIWESFHKSMDQLLIYPNPGSSIIAITVLDPVGTVQVEISTLYAQTVFSQKYNGKKVIEINIGELVQGAYVVKLSTEKKSYFSKIIKQ